MQNKKIKKVKNSKLIAEIPYFQEINDFTKLNKSDIVLDIRDSMESNKRPLKLKDISVSNFPYFEIHKNFLNLDKNKSYVLYCNYGMMSRLQAIYLYQKGFRKIKIFSVSI
ncbi:thiazole biosynthesis protein [Wigglesworthia glossinidia]|uniref:thiazole biosynthesis protein n=1 Tax=Wigglesworthia glossinidia TaxID=51229 RepID=UPI0002F4DE89|nr:thiazole biosynthesis protein [Wigglesworthia glossinidia]